MGRFQSCKGVLERSLRRAFYDGVLELYEGHGSTDTVTAVTLEGTLTLTINRVETLVIRLNEVAQRAEEVSLEQEDSTHTGQEPDHPKTNFSDKEQECPSSRKRKVESADEADDKKLSIKKKLKTENACTQDTKKEAFPLDYAVKYDGEGAKDLSLSRGKDLSLSHANDLSLSRGKDLSLSQLADEKMVSNNSKVVTPKVEKEPESVSPIHIKREPEDLPADLISQISPGPSSTPGTSSSINTTLEEAVRDETASPRAYDLSFSVEVKKEPKVESILIEDDEDDDHYDLSRQSSSSSTVQQASPVHSLWYKSSQGSRHHHGGSSHHRRGSDREHAPRKTYPNPQTMDASDPHQMAVLLERNDCPMCGEVLHSRQDLSQHLHRHRQALRASCSVCRANTLTPDALLLHLSMMHSPCPLPPPITSAVASEALLSQALMPSLPYPPSPMSAIASLVSMAACQTGAGPGSATAAAAAAFLAGGSGLGSSLMERIISYRGLLPCPICQLLCSSKQHLAAHLALMHGDLSGGGGHGVGVGGGEEEGGEDGVGSETRGQELEDGGDGSGSAGNFSCFDCSMGFGSQAAFTQHCLLTHNATSAISQGSCSVCHRAFHTWKTLHAHYLSAHGFTNFCDRCKMGFVSIAELKTHYDSSHSGGAEARSLTFICDICNKGFYSQSQCSAHKRSHISEKSFACQVCGSAFFKRGDLSKHFRTVHAPNRVFACRFCGKRGTRMDNMRSHVKSHGKHMTRDEVLSFIEEVSPN